MDISICHTEKTIPQTLFWFLQPPCVLSPCNFSSDIGLALYWRLEVSNMWCGVKIFTPTGTGLTAWHIPFWGNLIIYMDLDVFSCLELALKWKVWTVFWTDASSGSEPFLSDLWSCLLSLWWKSQSRQHCPPFGKHCWNWSRSCLSKGNQKLK